MRESGPLSLLDLGPASTLDTPAAADHDRDGLVETRREELAGLEGTSVTVTFVDAAAPALLTLDGQRYA